MSDTPDHDLARRLDRHARPDGSDALHRTLDALRPAEVPADAGASARLWSQIEADIAPAPRRAPDRAPERVRASVRFVRWTVAAVAVVALGIGVWTFAGQAEPQTVAVAEARVEVYAAPDGSSVTLRPGTRLVRLGERAYRIEGEALFAVAPDADHPFTVEAGSGLVRVLGTRFDVSTWGNETNVFVDEGRVEVRASEVKSRLPPVVLGAGEAATVDVRGVQVASASRAEALDWQRGEAVFQSQTARRVADEIGHQFGVVIALPQSVAQTRVSGTVALDRAPDALADLGLVLGGRFEEVGTDQFLFVAP